MAGEVLTLSRAMKILYEEGRVPLADIIKALFPQVKTYDTEEIPMDRVIPKRILARYREKGGASNILAYTPGKGYFYTPPNLDESTPVDEKLAAAVIAGLEANAPAEARITKLVSEILLQHDDAMTRTIVKQVFDICINGKFQPVGKGGVAIGEPFDFERNTGNTIKKDYSGKAIEQLTDAYDQYVKMHGPQGRLFAIVGSSVLSALEDDDKFRKALELQALHAGVTYLTGENTVFAHITEMKIPGRAARFELFSFNEDYENEAGESVQYMNSKGLIFSSFNAPRMQLYGGVFIIDSNQKSRIMEGQMVTDSFVQKNPDAYIVRSQSRPLLVPGNVNHIVYAENTKGTT